MIVYDFAMIVIVNFVAPLLNFREILFALSWTCIGRLWGCCTDFRYLKGKSGWISGMAATIKKKLRADIVAWPSLRLVLVCGGGRFPPADRENKSSGPFYAVMSGEQVLRIQNCAAGFKLVVSWRLCVRLS